jgi:hypothetical protein
VNALEQQLIQAKLDAATVKTQLQEEKNRALLMKKQIKDQQKAAMVSGNQPPPQMMSKQAPKAAVGGAMDFLKQIRQQ